MPTLPMSNPVEKAYSIREVREIITGLCVPLEPERVALDQVLGRFLAQDVCTAEDMPPFDRSAVDGYAIRNDDPGDSFLVVEDIRAGVSKTITLNKGEAVSIGTGGCLPGDQLRVIMLEDVERSGNRIQVLRESDRNHIRYQGEDARAGSVMIKSGQQMHHGAVALAASIGHAELEVFRQPKVVHVVTGDELVAPDQIPEPGQIRDANSPLVRALLARRGIAVEQHAVPEASEPLQQVICNAIESGVDLILVSGGASVGERDYTKEVLAANGFKLNVEKTTTRPGKPLVVASCERSSGPVMAFGLPGNPLSHYVCLHLYVNYLLDLWSGVSSAQDFLNGSLGEELKTKPNPRETLWPARLAVIEGSIRLDPLSWTSSGDLKSLAHANALIYLPGGIGELAAGAVVPYISTEP